MFQAPSLARTESSFRNFVCANPGSFGSNPIDDWDAMAHGVAASFTGRNIARDSTAYGTEPTEDSWIHRQNGQQSPARPTGASGVVRTGSAP
jgi:hypothetical protein